MSNVINILNEMNIELFKKFKKTAREIELEKKLEIALSYLHVIKRLRNGKCFQCSDFAYRAIKKIKEYR